MRILNRLAGGALLVAASSAGAVTTYANSANFASVFARAAAGDRIVLSGKFGLVSLANRSWSTPVTIDASKASFGNSLSIKNVSGVSFIGGRYGSTTAPMRLGRAIAIYGGSDISFSAPVIQGNRAGVGLAFTGSSDISVTGARLTGLKVGLTLMSVAGGSLTGNRSLAAASDGFNIVDSRFVTATGNSCSGTVISPGAHPDCIQMWSIAGKPLMSDIRITGNTATGATQGFTLFNNGGRRITISDNRIDTSYPQGIACYGCIDSVFRNNVLTTQRGARFRTSINIVGGRNNVVGGNSVGAKPAGGPVTASVPTPVTTLSRFAASAAAVDLIADDMAAISAVPEPGVWLQLILGFAGVGVVMRRRAVLQPR